MLESKLAPFCCAGTSIHCLFCCGKHIFRPLWGKVPRSYRPVSASVYIIVLQLYERTKHDHIDRNVCFLFVKIKCILLLLKLNSAFIQLFSFPRILSGSFYFSVWSSAGTFTLLLPIHHCFCYFYTSPFCWVYGFHRLSTLILIKEHDKYIKKSQVNMRLPCKIL